MLVENSSLHTNAIYLKTIQSPHGQGYIANRITSAGAYHWQIDNLRMQLGIDHAPYPSSCPTVPFPKVVLYTPELEMGVINEEQHYEMIRSLLMVRNQFVDLLQAFPYLTHMCTPVRTPPCLPTHQKAPLYLSQEHVSPYKWMSYVYGVPS